MSRYSNSGTKENHAKLSFWSKQSIRHSIHIRTVIMFSTLLNWFKTSLWSVWAEKHSISAQFSQERIKCMRQS